MALLFLAACNLTVVDVQSDAITLDGTMRATTSAAPDGGESVTLAQPLEVIGAAQAARILRDQGPDRIGAIRGVTLSITSATYEGVDEGVTGAPDLSIGDHRMAPGTTSVDLDDAEVDQLRVALLTPKAYVLPIAFTFHQPKGADAVGDSVHVHVVVQPTLHVDVGRSF